MASRTEATAEETVLSDYEPDDTSEEEIGDSSDSEQNICVEGYCDPEYSKEELDQMGIYEKDQDEESDESEEEEADSSRMENLHWCTCGECSLMPSLIESKCCRECPNLLEDKLNQVKCITQHEEFSILCLNPIVLNTAFVQYRRKKNNYRLVKSMNNT